mmetsp:Transcript_14039/g.25990  ORF Transcript_14039/g.25990 Transcript_14039/m.25990 type:complete len:81 (-) Transcript_14039:361-603(-)
MQRMSENDSRRNKLSSLQEVSLPHLCPMRAKEASGNEQVDVHILQDGKLSHLVRMFRMQTAQTKWIEQWQPEQEREIKKQ